MTLTERIEMLRESKAKADRARSHDLHRSRLFLEHDVALRGYALDIIDELAREVERLRGLIRQVEHNDHEHTCLWCGWNIDRKDVHARNCPVRDIVAVKS